MQKLFLICFLVIIHSVSAQDRNVNSENVIQWQEAYRIEVSDFKKKRLPNDSYAFTAYKIEFYPSEVIVDMNDYIQGYESLTVVAEFHMDKSHFEAGYEKDLLKHEQITFDIAELFARKIRKRFEELKQKEEKRFAMYNNEYRQLWKACLEYQQEFNNDTNSGWGSPKKVEEWQSRINQELMDLKKYAIKPI
ncbi:hypothetical protein [Corallibacter sp.]|uniref:hypothetical protein n=1 Tax=Corallibacter sp. TaxID=2038084 RepID=UPI003AB48D0D